MNLLNKILEDHKKKSDQLRVLKKKMKKMKNYISVSMLESILAREKNRKVDWRDYYGWDGVDDKAYSKDVAKQEARVELLEELIKKCK